MAAHGQSKRSPTASSESSVSQLLGAQNLDLESQTRLHPASSCPEFKCPSSCWSWPPGKGQQQCNTGARSEWSIFSLPQTTPLQGHQISPAVVMGDRGSSCLLLCSLGLSPIPGAQLTQCFVPGQWRQASLALFCSTLHLFISCHQTAHIMWGFHAQYS